MEAREFKSNDLIVWDSGFGYEIGYFVGKGKMENTYECDMVTGIVQGLVSYSIQKLFPYTEELIDKLSKKYGYEKRFSKTF